MATKFKKKNVEKRIYKKNEGVLKVSFGFISNLKNKIASYKLKFGS